MIERYVAIVRAHQVELEEDDLEHLARLTEGWTLDVSTAAALEGLVRAADVPEDLNVRRGDLLARLQAGGLAGAVSVINQLELEKGGKR